MIFLVLILYWCFFVITVIALLGCLGASTMILTRFLRYSSRLTEAASVAESNFSLSMIVPIKGADSSTEAHLHALVESSVEAEVEYLFAMESSDDPAFLVCQRVQAAH